MAHTIVDVGSGNGSYLARLRQRRHRSLVVGVDLSPGMLAAARPRARALLVTADAVRLPLPARWADVALAMHMLYHVPQPVDALAELQRITRPDGRVIVLLNGRDHLQQMRDVVEEATHAADESLPHHPPRLTLDAGEELASTVFSSVTRLDLRAEIVIPDAGPILDYAGSMLAVQDSANAQQVRDEVARRLPTRWPFRVTTHAGVLICN